MGADQNYSLAKSALDWLFGDTSVPRATTREQLEQLRDEIEGMLDALAEDEVRDQC